MNPAPVSAPPHLGRGATIKRPGLVLVLVVGLAVAFLFLFASPALAEVTVSVEGSYYVENNPTYIGPTVQYSFHVHGSGVVTVHVYGVPGGTTHLGAGWATWQAQRSKYSPETTNWGSGGIDVPYQAIAGWTDNGGGHYSKAFASNAQLGYVYTVGNTLSEAESNFDAGHFYYVVNPGSAIVECEEFIPFEATLTGYRYPIGIGQPADIYGHDLQTDGTFEVRKVGSTGAWTEVTLTSHQDSPEGAYIASWPSMPVGMYDARYTDEYGTTDPLIQLEVMTASAADLAGDEEGEGGIKGWLKDLFIPNTEIQVAALDDLKASAATRFPFSVFVALDTMADEFSSAYYAGTPPDDFTEPQGFGIYMDFSDAYLGAQGFSGNNPVGGAGSVHMQAPDWWSGFHQFLTGFIWMMFVIGMYFRFMPKMQVNG